MKVIFINCISYNRSFDDLPLGIMSLVTVCNKQKDVDAQIVDFAYLYKMGILTRQPTLNENIDVMCQYIIEREPNVISLYSLCGSYHINIILSKRLKKKNPKLKILFGGPQATLTAEATLTAFPWIDYIGLGEGENTIVPILRAVRNGSLEMPEGVAYRTEQERIILKYGPSCEVENLPVIDYSSVDMSQVTSIPVDVGRGCPFGCTYCSTKTFWRREFRIKSVERIMEEISWLSDRYDIYNFAFVHDLFTANRQIVIEFCEEVLAQRLCITWSCSVRLDTLSDDLLEYMYKAGCRRIYLGIETGSPRLQKIINKNLNLELFANLLTYIEKYDIEFTCSFIYGFPEETDEDLSMTLEMIRTLWERGASVVQLHKATFLPGTALFEENKGFLHYNPLCSDFADEEYVDKESKQLIQQYLEIFPQFYSMKSNALIYPYIDSFVYYFYPILHDYMPYSYREIMSVVEHNMLSLYKVFQEIIGDLLEVVANKGSEYLLKMYHSSEVFDIIKVFFERYYYDEQENLKALARLEIDAALFADSKDDMCVIGYDFDVLAVLSNDLSVKECKRLRTLIKFKKTEEKKINISRVSM